MLDFTRLKTPPEHGAVLMVPDPSRLAASVAANASYLRESNAVVLGEALAEWRRQTRRRVVEDADGPIIVIGHQPELIHSGVWSKHVVAHRVARSLGGVAINLVVDNDSPRSADLRIPLVDQSGASLRTVRLPTPRSGQAHEQVQALSPAQIAHLRVEVRNAMEGRFEHSRMPAFFDGLQSSNDPADWVDQFVAGRRSVERLFDVELNDLRVSHTWWSPLLAEMLLNADKFAEVYNRALAWYRHEFRVRGSNRPMPDLARRGDAIELPVWVYRRNEPRRRLFVARRGDVRLILAESEPIATCTTIDTGICDPWVAPLADETEWRLRPRALTLTIWARLFLADLFIHGIGGAKYDRISDRIIADYFGISPPEMACVSATMHMMPADRPADGEAPADCRDLIRDSTWNPQRHLENDPTMAGLIEQRAAAVQRSRELREREPRNRSARRLTFQGIRDINQKLVAGQSGLMGKLNERMRRALHRAADRRIARDREYFFALFDRPALEQLLSALPAPNQFRV